MKTEYNIFQEQMTKIGGVFTPQANGSTAFWIIEKYIEVQITSINEQHESNLIAVSMSLRKPGFYFPLGETWAYNSSEILEKMQKILREYNIEINLVLRACW